MSAPLREASLDVLRALILGLELQKNGDNWCFIGAQQDPQAPIVSSDTMRPLLDAGYVREDAGQGRITDDGKAALAAAERALWECGLKWLRCPASRLNTC